MHIGSYKVEDIKFFCTYELCVEVIIEVKIARKNKRNFEIVSLSGARTCYHQNTRPEPLPDRPRRHDTIMKSPCMYLSSLMQLDTTNVTKVTFLKHLKTFKKHFVKLPAIFGRGKDKKKNLLFVRFELTTLYFEVPYFTTELIRTNIICQYKHHLSIWGRNFVVPLVSWF